MAYGEPLSVFPDRPPGAPGGDLFYERADHLALADREEAAFSEITSGNVPRAVRVFIDVGVRDPKTGRTGTIRVASDYLSIGEDGDCMRMPLTPITAQRVADTLGCLLPTTKLVDDIWRASVKQPPIPMTPPGAAQMMMPRFREHHRLIERARVGAMGDLMSGHKKDVVVTRRLGEQPPRVAIYGWHRQSGGVIQPFGLPHEDAYTDYSHGIRLVWGLMEIDGEERYLTEVLKDPSVAGLVSYEGVIASPRYRIRPLK